MGLSLSREAASQAVAAVNQALAAGNRPPGVGGSGPAAITVAADTLGISRGTMHTRLRTAKRYGMEPNWSLAPLGTPAVAQARQRVVAEPAFIQGATIYTSRPDDTYMFGVVSDTHLGSKYERLDVLNDLYDKFAAAKVDRVYHAGNWIEGESSFNRHELLVHGLDPQLCYMAKNYPVRDGLVTYAVSGDDHEGWFAQREGIDVGNYAEHIMRAAGRTDWINLGYMEAHVRLQNARTRAESVMAVVHPGGGSAYAVSYTVQKIIESLDGGEKPAVGIYGHYHKLMAMNIRNVWVLQSGCFDGRAHVETPSGERQINQLKIGDLVVTHRGRARPITDIMKRQYKGDALYIRAGVTRSMGRVGIVATAEHPFLTESGWQPASALKPGDYVAVKSKRAADGSSIPYFRDKSDGELFRSEPDKLPKPTPHNTALHEYLSTLPAHLRVVPTTEVCPDAVVVDFDKRTVVAVEIENNRSCPNNPRKYDLVPGRYDDVLWVCTGKKIGYKRYPYKVIDGNVFVPIKTIKKKTWNRRVFNISVAEDETYICGRFIVHNCTKDQDSFMRKKRIEAHVGGTIVTMKQDPDSGAIIRFMPEMHRYFTRGFYGHRWSHSGDVVLPRRSIG